MSVFERHAAPREGGAGIQVSPNAARVLDALGALDALRERAVAPEAIELRDAATGHVLSRFLLGRTILDRHGAPYLVCAREALREALEAVLPGSVRLRYGVSLERLRQFHDRAEAIWRDGEGEFDAVIGADGVGSFTRRFVPGAASASPTGWNAWRRTEPDPGRGRVTTVDLAPHEHRVAYPLEGGRTNRVWIREARAGPPPGAWERWPVLRVEPGFAWTHDRIALIGDAAHAMTPYAAQGGAMALEDAAVLAHCMAASSHDLPSALGDYVRQRRARIEAVARLSEGNRRIYHMDGAMRFARDTVLRLLPQPLLQRRMDFVYGWRLPIVTRTRAPIP